jgi:hypothetical protein
METSPTHCITRTINKHIKWGNYIKFNNKKEEIYLPREREREREISSLSLNRIRCNIIVLACTCALHTC